MSSQILSQAFKALKSSLLMCAFWVILSGTWDAELLIFMMISSVIVVCILQYLQILPNISFTFKGFRYVVTILKNMAISSLQTLKIAFVNFGLARLVGNGNTVTPGVKEISFKNLENSLITTLHVAAITMTPGTTVIEVNQEETKMLVHGICNSFLTDLPDKKIAKIIG